MNMSPPKDPRHLCANCLIEGARPIPVGQEFGTQRDPERHMIDLCPRCESALLAGRFDVLHEAYAAERTIRREG